jgi:N-acetylneuraminic acid mutarotase
LWLLVKCDEDQVTRRDYPRLKTLSVSEITSEGARFNAEIIFRGSFEVVNYGFVWGESENPTIDNNDRVVYSENIQSEKFSGIIETTLKEEVSYFVRAFVETNDFIVYGENVDFLSLGSKAPTIQSLSPNFGKVRDTISVIGKNFSYLNEKNAIFFNDFPSKIVASSDSLIKVIIPDQLLVKSSLVSASVLGNTASQKLEFSLIPPNIISFEPKSASTRETIKIYGKNFGISIDANQVLFNDVIATIINASQVELEVEVPSGIPLNSFLKVIASEQESTSSQSFEILTPEFDESIPNKATVNKEISLKGNNFSPFDEDNEVLFDGVPANILSSSKTTLQVEVPSGIGKRSIEVIVSTGGHNSSPISFEYVGGEWSIGSSFPGDDRYAPIMTNIENTIYYGLGVHFTTPMKDFWKYDVTTGVWTQLDDFPGEARLEASTFTINNKVYVGLGRNSARAEGSLSDFWEYDPTSDSWERLPDFPGEPRQNATSFVYLENAFVGLGGRFRQTNDEPYFVKFSDFYEFNTSTREWNAITSFPGGARSSASVFVINQNAYVGFGALEGSQPANILYSPDFWSFDLVEKTWTQTASFPGLGREASASFSINSRGYIGLGSRTVDHRIARFDSFYEYEPFIDTWTESQFNPNGSGAGTTNTVVINGVAYLVSISRTNKTPSRTMELFNPHE